MKHRYTIIFFSIVIFFASCYNYRNSRHVLIDNYMKDMYNEINESIPEADIKIIEDSIKVIFNGAKFFDVGQATLLPSTNSQFFRFSKVLNKYIATHLLILGHTDNTGNTEKNLELSDKRANSAKEKLEDDGVESSRLSSWGMGETAPEYDNNTKEGQELNRRIEFIILQGSTE